MNPLELGFATAEADGEVDIGAEESASAAVNVAPTLRRSQHRSFDAKRKQTIHVPIVRMSALWVGQLRNIWSRASVVTFEHD